MKPSPTAFTNMKVMRKLPHIFKHHGEWWRLRARSSLADRVYPSLKWWYYTDTGERVS